MKKEVVIPYCNGCKFEHDLHECLASKPKYGKCKVKK
jgi:hypothetical protein